MQKLLSVVLAVSMLLSLCTAFTASAEEATDNTTSSQGAIYSNGKVWFDLNGNARLFATAEDEAYKNRGSYIGYLPGVDFAGYLAAPTGNFAKDQAAVKFPINGGAMFLYTLNANNTNITAYTTPNFTTGADGNTYYTVNDVDYLVRTDKNIIKNIHTPITTTGLSDETKRARYESLSTPHIIDVPDGKYKKIGVLAGAMLKYTKKLSISLYYEGEAEPVVHNDDAMKIYVGTATNYTQGTMYLKNFTHTDPNNDGAAYFKPVEIATDSSKVLTHIEIDDAGTNNTAYPFYVISAYGEEQTLAEKITALDTLNTAGSITTDSYNAVKDAVEDIEKYLVNYSVSLTAEHKAVVDTAKANLSAYESALAQEKLYAANTEWFDLNGNAKLFMNKNSSDYTNRASLEGYLPGVDYAGYLATPTGGFASDKGSVTNPSLSIFTYTIDNSTDANSLSTTLSTPADFKTGDDGNLYFVYNDTSYRVDPSQNVIKSINQAITTTKITNTEDVARYESLKTGVTMDVPDGYYKSIGFLTAVYRAYSKAFKVELFYEGEDTPVLANDFYRQTPPKTDSGAWKSDIYFHTLTGVGSQASGHYLTPWTITIDSSKKLDKIRVYDCGATPKPDGSGTNGNNPTFPIYFISSWGDEVTLAERFTALETLNTADVNDKDSYQAVKKAVEEIEAVMAKASATSATLKTADKNIYDTAKANLAAFETTFKTANDNLVVKSELEFKGNSKLFMNAESSVYADRTNYKDYAPGLDYGSHTTTPYADFDSDYPTAANMVNTDGFGVFPYTINKGTVAANAVTIPDFSKGADGNIYWNIDTIDYLIKPEEKVIKLVAGTSLYNLKDAETKAKYDSLNGVTIDITDGKYESVGFLAGIYSQSYTRNLYVTLVYEDGEEIETSYPVTGRSSSTNTFATGGVLYQPLSSNTDLTNATTNSSQYWHSFTPITVPANNTKTLVSIKVEPDSTKTTHRYPLYVISAWKTHTIKNALSAVTANTSKADAKVILYAVNKTLAENDITADDLTAETKAKYELAKACANSLEVTSASFADSKVSVSYKTGTDTAVKVIVAEYEDENETTFKKVTILPAELTADKTSYEAAHTAAGAKVKVFVWKDMVNFFPYY